MVEEDESGFVPSDPVLAKLHKFRDEQVDVDMLADATIEKVAGWGYPAVPALIEAINDRSFTRSQYHPSLHPWHEFTEGDNVRIGDIALRAIEDISQINFNDVKTREQAYKRAKNWHNSVLDRGMKNVLIEGVLRNDHNTYRQARELIESFPASAFAPIAKAFNKANAEMRHTLMSELRFLKTAEVYEFARHAIRVDKSAAVRIEAANILAAVEPNRALDAMWRELKQKSPSDETLRDVSQCLANALRPELIVKLQQELPRFSAPQKYELLGDINNQVQYTWKFKVSPDVALSKPWLRAIEDIYASVLSDRGKTGNHMSSGDNTFINASIAEMALYDLSYFFPKVYKYKKPNSESDLRAQLRAALRSYRSRR
jgi:hypothetical protein